MGHASEARNYLGGTELFFGRLPTVLCNLPDGLGDKGRKGKPVVILVSPKICKGEEEELVQFRGLLAFGNASPDLHDGVSGIRDVEVWTHLVGECIEEGSLIGVLAALDCVLVLEHATRRHGPGRDTATMVSRVGRWRLHARWLLVEHVAAAWLPDYGAYPSYIAQVATLHSPDAAFGGGALE